MQQLIGNGNRKKEKIFGVGNLKTGTTSLGSALEILGYKHTHEQRRELLSYVREKRLNLVYRWVDQYDSFEDWPYPLIYRHLDRQYPNSRFILTIRSSAEIWLNSMLRHAECFGPTFGREDFFGYAMPQGHESEYLAKYEAHNQEIDDYFRDRPNKLLKVCWDNGDGWPQLCSFLGKDVPDVPFPTINTAENRINK